MMKDQSSEYFQASEAAKSIFHQFDTDRNGYLDSEEVLSFVKEIINLSANPDTISADGFLQNIFRLGD